MSKMAPPLEVKPLRKCRVCGLEAWTEEDLEKFTSHFQCRHRKDNWCKPCRNIYNRKHPLKNVYSNMIDRCYNPKRSGYSRWGGRGITVCTEWRILVRVGLLHAVAESGCRK